MLQSNLIAHRKLYIALRFRIFFTSSSLLIEKGRGEVRTLSSNFNGSQFSDNLLGLIIIHPTKVDLRTLQFAGTPWLEEETCIIGADCSGRTDALNLEFPQQGFLHQVFLCPVFLFKTSKMYSKLDQVYCAWLIISVVKRDKVNIILMIVMSSWQYGDQSG